MYSIKLKEDIYSLKIGNSAVATFAPKGTILKRNLNKEEAETLISTLFNVVDCEIVCD